MTETEMEIASQVIAYLGTLGGTFDEKSNAAVAVAFGMMAARRDDAMTTKSIGPGYKVTPDGKIKKRPPRMPPVLAAGQRHKADRQEKRLRENAAKAGGRDDPL